METASFLYRTVLQIQLGIPRGGLQSGGESLEKYAVYQECFQTQNKVVALHSSQEYILCC